MNHDPSTVLVPPENQDLQTQNDNKDEKDNSKVERAKMVASKEVVQYLRELFAEMLISNRKYADPTRVLEAIVDENAQKLTICLTSIISCGNAIIFF